MARPVTTLVIFFIFLNLFAGVLMSTDAAAAMGIETNVGGDDAVDEVTGNDDVESGAPTGSTLFGMYNVLAEQVGGLFDVIYPGIEMMQAGGLPNYLANKILEPLATVIIIIDVISFFRGWGL